MITGKRYLNTFKWKRKNNQKGPYTINMLPKERVRTEIKYEWKKKIKTRKKLQRNWKMRQGENKIKINMMLMLQMEDPPSLQPFQGELIPLAWNENHGSLDSACVEELDCILSYMSSNIGNEKDYIWNLIALIRIKSKPLQKDISIISPLLICIWSTEYVW